MKKAFIIVELPPSLKFRRASLIPNNNIKQGFTIVELLVVIVVIGILAAITIVSYTGISGKATVASLQSDLANASKKLKMDQVINNSYPTNLADAVNRKVISYDSNTTPTYVVNNNITPQVFCLSYTKNSQTYKVTETGTSTTGDCTNYLPVLYLDAGNTASYPGTGTTWTDLSGNSNNGTLYGGVTYNSANGGALTFDGVDDYVIGPTLTALPAALTIESWAYFSTASNINNQVIASVGTGNPYARIGVNAGYMFATVKNDATSATSATTAIPAIGWHYFIAACDGVTIRTYLNGISGGTIGQPSAPNTPNGFSVGAWGTGAYPYTSSIATLRIYSRTLSSTEITQNFNATKGRYGL